MRVEQVPRSDSSPTKVWKTRYISEWMFSIDFWKS